MTFGLRLCAVAFLIANVFSLPAAAALTAEQLASVGVNPPPGATLPLDAPLKDLDGRSTTLRRVIADAPAVIVFADYRCTQLCSPILAVTGQALAKSGLDPGRDYRLIVVGFNPAATAADARQMVAGQIGFDTPVGRATFPLMGSERSVRQLTTSVGYHFVYDAENTRFAHPAALLIVTPGGRLSRLLTGLSITGDDARSALIEAKSGARGRVRQPGPVALLRPRRLDRTLWRPSANSACGGWRGDAARHRRGAPAVVARRRKRARVISFLPRQASTFAPQTDALYFTLLGISGAIVLLVFALIVVFSIRYRRGSSAKRGTLPPLIQHEFEIGWTSATLFAFLMLFWWAGSNEVSQLLPPRDAMEIHVVAKQWMWKIQHPNGAREINTLHVPVDEPVRLDMTSQDVIHSFAVPAFRIKQDILPGRYVETGFRATETGVFHLFCTQFCGTAHSGMVGSVVVMSKPDFAAWLTGQRPSGDLVAQGRALFTSLGCAGCHEPGGPVHAPDLSGLYGRKVPLADGQFALVDDAYLRDRILDPKANPPAGYDPIMPSFKGEVDDAQILELTAYIRSLSLSSGVFR